MIGRAVAGWPGAVQAAFWMLMIGTLSTVTLVIARELTPAIHVFEIVFFRSVFGLAFMAPWVARRGIRSLSIQRPQFAVLRSALAFFGSACLFYAAALMPLAGVTAITFTRPIFASIAAMLFLGEVLRFRRLAAIAGGLVGALIIVRPGVVELNVGVLFALGAVVTLTWNTINIKILTAVNPPDVVAIWNAIAMLPLGLVASLLYWTTPSLDQLVWLVAVGVVDMLAQRSMSRAYAAADVAVVVAFSFIRLPIAAGLGFVLFGEVPEVWVWLGAAVIALSSVAIARREAAAGG